MLSRGNTDCLKGKIRRIHFYRNAINSALPAPMKILKPHEITIRRRLNFETYLVRVAHFGKSNIPRIKRSSGAAAFREINLIFFEEYMRTFGIFIFVKIIKNFPDHIFLAFSGFEYFYVIREIDQGTINAECLQFPLFLNLLQHIIQAGISKEYKTFTPGAKQTCLFEK